MKTRVSEHDTDYIFYPIEFKSNALENVISLNHVPDANFEAWVVPVDKKKFLCGSGCLISTSHPSEIRYDVISVGF